MTPAKASGERGSAVMMFPKDRPVYENLNTSFIHFEELLTDLAARRFTGFVRVAFRGYEGVLFVSAGEVLNAVVERDQRTASGETAMAEIVHQARERGGSISVYELAALLLDLLARLVDSETVYRDLTTSFTSPDRLIDKLQSEGHTGYVEATLGEGRGYGMIFFEQGEAVEAVLSDDKESVSGPTIVDAIIQAANSVGASFNVFRAPRVATPAPPSVPGISGPAVATVAPAAPAMSTADIVILWQEVLAATEQVVDGFSSKGRFLTAFKEALVEHASTYPFLDPFAAEFEYRDGQVIFHGPLPADFSQGLGACLEDAVNRLSFALRRSDLETKIRSAITALGEGHAALAERSGLAHPDPEALAS